MITADDDYYATLKTAGEYVQIFEINPSHAGAGVQAAYPFAKALLDVEERRQLALGELGEALMKEGGGPLYAYIDRTIEILAGRVEV